MNELIFFGHILCVFFATLGAARMGKKSLHLWICLQAVFANLFVLKEIDLFSLTVTASDAFAVGCMLGLNLMQEKYQKEATKETIRSCLYTLITFACLSEIHLLYTPSPQDGYHAAYQQILGKMPRLFIASLLSFFLVQQFDRKLFSFLRSRLPQQNFALRNAITLYSSQALDTLLFTYLGLYGLVHSCSDVLFISFIVKVIIITLLTPFAFFLHKKVQLPV